MFNFIFKIERWKFNKTYQVYVSNQGRFRNKSKANIPIKVGNGGYCYIRVECSTCEYVSAHRLVMLTWRPTPDAENLTVDHKDHNKRNNALDNLEWVSNQENLERADRDLLLAVTQEQLNKLVAARSREYLSSFGLQMPDLNAIPKYVLSFENTQTRLTIGEVARIFHRFVPKKSLDYVVKSIKGKIEGATASKQKTISMFGYKLNIYENKKN